MVNVIGLIFIYGGFFAAFRGYYLNSNLGEQFKSLLLRGLGNPGTVSLVVGVLCIILGTVIILVHTFKKPKKKPY